jgi:hypothetical protein
MGGESGSKNDSARGHLSAIFPRGAIAIFPSRRVEGCFSYLKECRQPRGYGTLWSVSSGVILSGANI